MFLVRTSLGPWGIHPPMWLCRFWFGWCVLLGLWGGTHTDEHHRRRQSNVAYSPSTTEAAGPSLVFAHDSIRCALWLQGRPNYFKKHPILKVSLVMVSWELRSVCGRQPPPFALLPRPLSARSNGTGTAAWNLVCSGISRCPGAATRRLANSEISNHASCIGGRMGEEVSGRLAGVSGNIRSRTLLNPG